jgi:hypothetical protein
LMFIGVPVGIAFCVGMITGALILGVSNIQFIAQGMYNGFNNLPIIAIPCFILAGSVMETGGLSKRLVEIANRLVGNMTGGLGAVTIVACLFFGAVSGSGPACCGHWRNQIPSMVRTPTKDCDRIGACAGGPASSCPEHSLRDLRPYRIRRSATSSGRVILRCHCRLPPRHVALHVRRRVHRQVNLSLKDS